MEIFWDVDGVLIDLDKAVEEEGLSWHGHNNVWHQPASWWANLPPTPLFYDVAHHIHKGYILTSFCHNTDWVSGRQRWLEKNLGRYYRKNIVLTASKWLLARPDRLLIDDFAKNTDPWILNGGKAILYDGSLQAVRQVIEAVNAS